MDPTFRSADMDLPGPGQVIAGKYRVDGVIGSGGMGVVLGATDATLGRSVAIKFLAPHKARREGAVARFVREARAAASIQSEHVVRVFEVGTLPNGAPYIVMEHLRGSDLSQELQGRGPLAIPVAVDHLLEACEALGEAHARGIVHRDLKPQNLFVTTRPDGAPCLKILDFGISKAIDEGAPNLTSTDQVMGTPLYMSPEQVRSLKNVDQRSDIWALGSILFELVTGRPIYEAPSASALCAMIAMDPPIPLRARLPAAPPGLEGVILRCLHKDPGGRYQDVAQLAEALAPFASDRGRASATRVSRVVRQTPSASGGGMGGVAHAMTPGASGIPHVGAGSSATVDGRNSYGPPPEIWHRGQGGHGPWAAPPAALGHAGHAGQLGPGAGSMIPPNGSSPPAHAGSAVPPAMMPHGPQGPAPGTHSTWQQSTSNLTQTGERRGSSPVVVALFGVLAGVLLLGVLVLVALFALNPRPDEASGGAARPVAASRPGDGGGPGIVAAAAVDAAASALAATPPSSSSPPAAARKDAGAPGLKPAPKPPSGPTPEEIADRKRSAESRCSHQSFLLSQDKAPEHIWANNVKNQTCAPFPDRPACERTLCMRACQILSDQRCLDEVERLNRSFPPPF
jgi:serine/threonine-protein kinase